MDAVTDAAPLKETPLADLHRRLGARMVPFAGYAMPVQYGEGIIAEHRHTRQAAGLFDVSHMGQAMLVGSDHAGVSRALEALTPGDFQNLAPRRIRYTLLLNGEGGIIDDLMVTRSMTDGRLLLIVNAARKEVDYAHIASRLPRGTELVVSDDRALLALQGPLAARVLSRLMAGVEALGFMSAIRASIGGIDCHVSRSGYTGEDGFEISLAAKDAQALAELLLAEAEVKPIGLGARDSLRLEAGLCLYGHDIDETTSPVEAGLNFALSKRRREEGGFPGVARINRELVEGPRRYRVGILPDGPAPAREGTEILSAALLPVGRITSGGFSPMLNRPIAMGYVAALAAKPGTSLNLIVRGKSLAAAVHPLPFIPHNYHRQIA